MDDLKLLAKSKAELEFLLNTVHAFGDDIEMQFSLSKCATSVIKGGKVLDILQLMS